MGGVVPSENIRFERMRLEVAVMGYGRERPLGRASCPSKTAGELWAAWVGGLLFRSIIRRLKLALRLLGIV